MKRIFFLLVTLFTILGHQANAQQIVVITGSAMGNIGDVVNVPVYVILPQGAQGIEACQGAIVSSDPSVATIVGATSNVVSTNVVNNGAACNFLASLPFTLQNGILLTLQVQIVGDGCSEFELSPIVGQPSSAYIEFLVNGVVYDDLATDFIVNAGTVCANCANVDCLNFIGIEVLSANGCDYEFAMDYNFGNCGPITIISETWDFGHPGGTGTGTSTTHTFPGNGTYTVTATVQYMAGNGQIFTGQQTLVVTVQGCLNCDMCMNFVGIEVFNANGCDYEFFMDYNFGNCGPITILSHTWDFGHPGGTGTGIQTNHTFPGNGTYTVTATVQYQMGNGQVCTGQLTRVVTVQGCFNCQTCMNFIGIVELSSSGCDYEFFMDYNFGSCGPITILSHTWNFGHPGGTGTGIQTNHTFPGNGTYTVTATVQYQMGNGQICTAQQTRVVTVQGCVCLLAPPTFLDCQPGINPNATFHTLFWSPVAGAVSYQVQFVYNDPACCPGVIGLPTSTIVSTTSTSMNVPNGTCYSWRVRAVCANGLTSAWSSRRCSCGVKGSDGKSLIPSGDLESGQVRLATVPNPATNHVDITLSGVSAELTLNQPEVFIFDLAGKVIFSSQLNVDEAKRVDLSDFEPGTYIIKAVDGDTILSTEKLVVH